MSKKNKKSAKASSPAVITRTEYELNQVSDKAGHEVNQGTSKFPGMSYEEGVRNTIDWVLGDIDDNPMED